MDHFLKVCQKHIYCRHKKIMLRGVNLGGWLLMEGYILHSLNQPEAGFKKRFQKALGREKLIEFESSFRNSFIREEDFRRISQLGFNCVRVPFHYALIEREPYAYDRRGVKYLDHVVSWAKRHKLWVIFDLHAACGSQNHDWHSDSSGKAKLWTTAAYRRRTCALWEFIARRYRKETAVAGYDLLNEAVVQDSRKLNALYRELIQAIRRVDRNHILFLEGNKWATDLACLDSFEDDNIVLSAHFYDPLDFTFNFVPDLSYPFRSANGSPLFTKSTLRKILSRYHALAQSKGRPLFIGEFGINYRQTFFGEDKWLADVLDIFRDWDFHWTYWTYKAVKNHIFPDGLLSFYQNPSWVRREGPILGWDNFGEQWLKNKRKMCLSWQTPSFKPNEGLLRVLKRAVRK